MQPRAEAFAHFLLALPPEAKPLVSHYRLKRRPGAHAFAMFERDGISLTVCGPGKAAAAAAVGYTQAVYGDRRDSLWLNVGIAGHRSAPLGSVWLAHKITDGESGRRWYPALCFRAQCPSAELLTVGKPETEYTQDCLYDMEAAAFVESACRFSTGELVHCLKVVSDNRQNGIAGIDPARASSLIEGAIEAILHTKRALRHLAAGLGAEPPDCPDAWTSRWHFSAQQRLQLRKLIQRWRALSGQAALPEPPDLPHGRELLAWLTRAVEAIPVRFGSNRR